MRPRSLPLALVALIVLGPVAATAQTIRPLVSEYRGKASGRIELVNDGDRPLTVVLELKGFRVDEKGEVYDEPMPDAVTVRLSSTSVRIPARQTRYVFYDATSTATPRWFTILARFAGYSRSEFSGIDVQLEMPHYVYVLPDRAWKAEDLRVVSAVLDREQQRLVMVVQNDSADFGRVSKLEVRGSSEKAEGTGFPVFPGARRTIELPWPNAEAPETVTVRAPGSSVQRRLPF